MDFTHLIKKTPTILIAALAIFMCFSFIPNLPKLTIGDLTMIISTSTIKNILFIISTGIAVVVVIALNILIHYVFIPQFVAMVEQIDLCCKISKYSLFVMAGLLLLEIVVPSRDWKNVFHVFSLFSFMVHIISYHIIVRLTPFTMTFLRSKIQSIKVMACSGLLLSLFFKLVLSGTIEYLLDWFCILLTLLIGLCYVKDLKEFIVNYYSDVDIITIDHLNDLDNTTMKELEQPTEVVTI